MACNEIIFPIHRSCGRVLKPTIVNDIDYLVCRYCDFKVKVSKIRLNGLSAIKKARIEIEKKFEVEDIKIYKGHNEPKECPLCDSKRLRLTNYPNIWECLECEAEFEWKKYKCVFTGDVEVYASNHDMATELAYKYLKEGKTDIEADVSLY